MEMTNPYQTPAGELNVSSSETGVIKFFSPNCRIGRLRYLAHVMLATLVLYAVLLPMALLMAQYSDFAIFIGLVLGAVYIGAVVVLFIILIQRLHDLNHSGWLSLLSLVPIVNIPFAIWVLFWPGAKAPNNYGPPPPPNRTWHWIVAMILPFIAVLGIVAAVALPAYQEYTKRVEEAMQTQSP